MSIDAAEVAKWVGLFIIVISWGRAVVRRVEAQRRLKAAVRVMSIFGLGPVAKDVAHGRFDWIVDEDDYDVALKRAREQVIESEKEEVR